jgi:DNA repair exonuclease SbcCD ATPase subunit
MVEVIKLEIEGFGKFDKKKNIKFKRGVNFINGPNEAGKSTILEAILASLFKYRKNQIEPFFCWTNKDVCRVSLTYKTDENLTYRIQSDYKNNKRKLEKVTNKGKSLITTSKKKIEKKIRDHFGFDDQKVFENTAFVRQSQMAILNDSGKIKNKLRDMVEEVLVGSAEASATKALEKIKKVAKESRKEADILKEKLEELQHELRTAEENDTKLKTRSKEHEKISKELESKSDELNKLKENKKSFDEKESLLKDQKRIDEDIKQADEMLETLEGEKEVPAQKAQSKKLPIGLIVVGVLLSITLYGAVVGIPLIIYGIYKLVKKPEEAPTVQSDVSEKIAKYKKHKKDLINKKAVIESKLEKYKLVNFSLDDFNDLEKLEEEVEELKSKNIELKTSISTNKQLVKNPEEIQEKYDTTENRLNELKEKAGEYEIAAFFLEKAENEVQQKFTPSIEKNSKTILKEVTDDKYSELKISEEDLDISIKAPEIEDFVSVEFLSQGAKDQIYFTIRTVMADLLSGNLNIPLIFDDPFHNFDDVRLNKTISAVKELSKKKQIILISHKQYQKDYKDFPDNIIEVQ